DGLGTQQRPPPVDSQDPGRIRDRAAGCIAVQGASFVPVTAPADSQRSPRPGRSSVCKCGQRGRRHRENCSHIGGRGADFVRIAARPRLAQRLHRGIRVGVASNAKELAMHTRKLILTVLASSVLAFGCNRAESPQEVQEDVADAQQDAAEATSEAREEVAQATTPEQTVQSEYDLAITDAEGKHKVAIEACEAMAAEQQEACKARADEELEAAKQRAESLRVQP
ncbi:MAG TPA: hypothetical protein VK864_05105, partial [Longimicrobiales bacterium]|nr:hypothetical protein [Longimicrobiales bacterium]